jgi:diguanylate cyclase (GGDEF)-like protein/PAS domain S-box-containing protein
MTGYETADVFGKTPKVLRSGRHDADFYAAMWRAIERDGFWQGEVWDRRKNGEIYPEWLTIAAVRNPRGKTTHYVGSFWDITQRVEDETKVRNLAYYDPLTGLANRRLLTDRLTHAFAMSVRSRSYGALLFIDLDRFKELNDTLGHAQGDRLLELVADRLTANVREVDTVARFGGDEFVVLLEELDCDRSAAANKAMALAEKLRAALNAPYQLPSTDAKDWHCSPSIGVAPFRGHDQDVETVLALADKALYAAKEAGRNTVRLAGV